VPSPLSKIDSIDARNITPERALCARMTEFTVRQVPAELPGDEQWERDPYDDYQWVGVIRDGNDRTWQVEFAMCQVPLGALRAEVHGQIESAIMAVPGVESVHQEDQEVWIAIGESASGEALMRAAGTVADALADRVREYGDTLEA
jgi:hypothetical protein